MRIIDRGSGPALVLIPGVQGRWEYVAPAIDTLSKSFRVVTFPLADERSAGWPFDPSRGLDGYVDHVRAILDEKRISRAILCGISYGGLIAARTAALYPQVTSALILVSTPASGMRLKRRHRIYLHLPWILGPMLVAESPWRLRPELRTAMPDAGERRRFALEALKTFVRAPLSFSRMAARARLLPGIDLRSDLARITAPTLVITGEPGLDYVVPVEGTSEYVRLIPGARHAVIARTGHLGSVTRPDVFAAIVRDFVASATEVRFPDAAA